jgi:NADH-quinone oxidoreductase subunit G
MTAQTTTSATGGSDSLPVPAEDLIAVTIDDVDVHVPKGTLIIRAAELIGVQIPRFCDHPLLEPVGACRQCLVDVEGQRKPLASCTTTVSDGMVVRTQHTSPVADKAQRGNMELLLINHPLDCPICDKGGECPLQNQAMSNGQGESRFEGVKRTFEKPVPISAEILLDRERCVLCARCTRFAEQIAGDPFIELLERGSLQQVGIYEDQPFESYFSGNTVQICPVGALTSAAYRFRARPFDLVSTPSTCEHCASGCSIRVDHRRGKVMRRLAGDDPQVNEEWNCDKGRFAFTYATQGDRITTPFVRNDNGELVPTSWAEAIHLAARGLEAACDAGGVGVLPGGRVTVEDAYGYSKFARAVLKTNDIDMRARPHSEEEADFLASHVAGSGLQVTYSDLEKAPFVLLAGFEPEDESPIVFLRLRKAARRGSLRVASIAAIGTRGLKKMRGSLIATVPGNEAVILASLDSTNGLEGAAADAATGLREAGAVILVGERLASTPGALSAAAALAASTGARLAWIPRRAGERGAVSTGALPNLLPGGRPVNDATARQEVANHWGSDSLPEAKGRRVYDILTDTEAAILGGLLIGGVELADLPHPVAARRAVNAAGFVVSLEVRASEVTSLADVVLPVAPMAEKAGTFVDWEGRSRTFDAALASNAMSDHEVLHAIADEMGVDLGLPEIASVQREIWELGGWTGARPAAPTVAAEAANAGSAAVGTVTNGASDLVLATWRHLLDRGRLQDGEPHLAATAHTARARIAATTARDLGANNGDTVEITTPQGSLALPLDVVEDANAVAGVVWIPTNSLGSTVRQTLGVDAGAKVRVLVTAKSTTTANVDGGAA